METSALSGAMQKLLRIRRSAKAFDPSRLIADDILNELKENCLRAPSSFNAQPFRCVLVRDDRIKHDLAHAMVGLKNAQRVCDAAITAVFLADTESWKNLGASTDVQGAAETFQERKRKQADVAFVSGSHGTAFRKLVENASMLAPTKIPEDPVLWSVKQTVFFADHWLLSSAALGLVTSPMEGFDEPRVREAVGASSRYYCPMIIPTGYEKEQENSLPEEAALSPRFKASDMFIDNRL